LHHVKCKSAPVPLKEWALEEPTKMNVEARLREEAGVKDMEGMFNDIKEEATQTKLTETNKDKRTASNAVLPACCRCRPLPPAAAPFCLHRPCHERGAGCGNPPQECVGNAWECVGNAWECVGAGMPNPIKVESPGGKRRWRWW
jgi:hypothetical protein